MEHHQKLEIAILLRNARKFRLQEKIHMTVVFIEIDVVN